MFRLVGWRVWHICAGLLAALMLVLAPGCRNAPSNAPDAAPVTLNVLMTHDWAETAPFLDAVKEFEQAHPNVLINIEKLQIRLMSETVRSRVNTNNPPDVVQWHAFAAGAQGLAEPVEDLWAKYGVSREEFFPGAVADVAWGGHLYGVPLDTNALVMFYRPGDLSSANLSVSDIASFPRLQRATRELTSADGHRAIALPNSYWSAYGWIRSNGGEIVEIAPDGIPRFTFNSPEVVEAVDFLAQLVRSGQAIPPAAANSGNDTLSLFRSGATSLFVSGSWDLNTLSEVPFDVVPMPGGVTGTTEGSVMGGSSLFVAKGSQKRELAFEFMNLLTSDRYALRFAQEQGRLPVRSRVFEDPYFQDPKLQVFLTQLKTAHPFLLEAFPQATKHYETALTSVLVDGADAAQTLAAAQAAAEQTLVAAGPGP
ncbi:MAG: ABC transporter substrate-binding protein [Actinomycetota bacterium]